MKRSRRNFIKVSAVVGAGTFVPSEWWMRRAAAQVVAQVPLAGGAIPQFVDPLPGLAELGAIVDDGTEIALHMREFAAQTLPAAMYPVGVPGTYVWGYLPQDQTARTTHLGPIIVATRRT